VLAILSNMYLLSESSEFETIDSNNLGGD
jgi:hypothetical protein